MYSTVYTGNGTIDSRSFLWHRGSDFADTGTIGHTTAVARRYIRCRYRRYSTGTGMSNPDPNMPLHMLTANRDPYYGTMVVASTSS